MLMFGGYTSAAARAAQQGCFTRDREPGIKGTQGAPALRRLWSRVVITSSPNSPRKDRLVTQDPPGRSSRGWARGRTRDEASAVVQGPSQWSKVHLKARAQDRGTWSAARGRTERPNYRATEDCGHKICHH